MFTLKPIIVKVGASAICSLVLMSAAFARAEDRTPREFDIRPQSLAAALSEFARQADQEILFAPQLVAEKKFGGIRGKFAPLTALQEMLDGTGLQFATTPSGAILIQGPGSAAVEGASGKTEIPRGFWSRLLLAQAAAADTAEPSQGSRPAETANDQPSTEKVGTPIELGEIVVMARNPQPTLAQGVIPRIETGALPFKIVTRAEIERSGATSAPALMRNLVQNQASVTGSQNTDTTRQGVTDQSLNLRGFGASQTLILMNDRRLGTADGAAANSLAIPLSMVERVEMLSGASSAMYGAGALGGVVNYILRNDFTGAEIDAYLGDTTSGGSASELRGNLIAGHNFLDGRLNVLVAGQFAKQEQLTSGETGYANELIERRIARAPDTVFTTSPLIDMPGNIRAPTGTLGIPGSDAAIAFVPANYDGVNRGAASYTQTAGAYNLDRNFATASNETVLLPEAETTSAFGQAVYAFTPNFAGFVEFLYNSAKRPQDPAAFRFGTVQNVPANNPYNPFGRAVQIGFVPLDVGLSFGTDSYARRTVAGVKGTFGETWRWSADYTDWSQDTYYERHAIRSAFLAAAIASTDPATAYNPFADLRTQRPNSEQILAPIRFLDLEHNVGKERTVSVRAAGTISELSAGPLQVSVGAEQRRFEGVQSFGGTSPLEFNPFDRKVDALYAEMQVPLVSPQQAMPLVSKLELSVAARYEKYHDSISTTNPALAVLYMPHRMFGLRGSFSTGYFPPRVQQLIPGVPTAITGGQVPDPRRPGEFLTNAQQLAGGNPDLQEEKATGRTFGVVIVPSEQIDLQVAIDYYLLEKKNAITSLNANSLLANEAFFPERVTRDPPLSTDPPGVPGPVTFLDVRPINASTFQTKGWDISFDYSVALGSRGKIFLSGDATIVREFERRILPVQPIADLLDQPSLGGPLRSRASLTLSHEIGGLTTSITTRRFSSYRSTVPAVEGSEIPASTELDVNIGYDFGAGWLEGTRFDIGALNVLDERPPFQISQGYSQFNDPRQRFVYLRLVKGFQ